MRKRTRVIISATLLLTAVMLIAGGPGAQAQTGKRFAMTGVTELGGSLSFQSITPVSNGNTGDATNYLTVAPFIGYFVTDGFELGFNPFGITYISSGGSSSTQIMILIAPSYNFQTQGSAYPFIEGLVGYTSSSSSNASSRSGISFGARAGVKVEVAEHGLLNVGVQYLQITMDPEGADNRNGSNNLGITAGFTIWL